MIRKAKHSSAANRDGSGQLGSVFGRPTFAARAASRRAKGSGARSSSLGLAARTPSLRLLGLAALCAAVFALALGATPASAAFSFQPIGEITGPEAGVPFGSLKSESVAVNDQNGHIYVADSGAHRIYDFASTADAAPSVWDGTSTPEGEFEGNLAVAVDNSSGDVYVADSTHAVIDKFDENGNLIASFGDTTPTPDGQLKGLATPAGGFLPAEEGSFGIAVDQETHDLYAIDAGHEAIDAFDQAGAFLPAKSITEPPSEGELYGGGGAYTDGLAVNDNSGELLVSDSWDLHTYRFELATGIFIAAIDGSETPGGSFGGGYTSVAADDSNGQIYINDTEHEVVDAYNPNGIYSGSQITGTPASPFSGLAVDQASSDLYVASGAGAVKIFEAFVIPDATTEAATDLSDHSATLNGLIGAAGGPEATCVFQYETEAEFQANPELERFHGAASAPCEPAGPFSGTGTEAVHADLSGLSAGTTYHYRLLATNENGSNPGADQPFTTLGPAVDSTSASAVSATAATLETEINPHGLPTTYRFEYDTVPYVEGESPHGTAVPIPDGSAGSGEADVARTAQIQGLQPLTTYHYRVVAENSLGTAFGPDRSFTTQGPGSSLLPDERAWEMVSPQNKHGANLRPIGAGLIQAAADGSAITSIAGGPLGAESQGSRSPEDSQLLSRRGPDGWTTQDITTPHEEFSPVVPGISSEYRFFAADLSAGVVEPKGATPLSPQTTERTPYRREADGTFVPLVTAANVPSGTKFGGEERDTGSGEWINGVEFDTASPDLSHIVLSSRHVLAAGFEAGFVPTEASLYELSGGVITLVSVLPDGEPAAEAGLQAAVGNLGSSMRGAISSDGQRVFFGVPGELFMRANATAPQSASGACDEPGRACTLQLDAADPLCASCESGGGVFQAASSDGSRVFFTDTHRLTEDSTATEGQPDLYMCEIPLAPEPSCALTDLTANTLNPAEPADVHGMVLAIDAGGDHVYFVAGGVLTEEANDHGEGALPGAPNLYEYDTIAHQIHLVAVLSPDDRGLETNYLGDLTARSSPDGRWFTFMSTRSLTGYDNRDAKSGQPDAEVYLFDTATDALRCVSCNPSGARPKGVFDPPQDVPGLLVDPRSWRERWLAGSVPGWTEAVPHLRAPYQSRYLSNSGRTFFNASDALVPSDTNGLMDVYEFEPPGVGDCTESSPTYGSASGGCVSLISSGTSPEESAFLDASENGNDVFFLTQSRLSPREIDSAFDVYDARVGGGEPPLLNPPACEGDACQQPAVPPSEPTLSTSVPSGPGNLRQCPRGKVLKHGRCVVRHERHKGKKHKHRAKHHRKGTVHP